MAVLEAIILNPITELANTAISLFSQIFAAVSDSLKNNATLTIFIVSAFISIIIWYLNERSKRSILEYKIKEERYVELIDLIEELKDGKKPGDDELRPKFIHQINLCWLYCSDDVVRKIIDLVSKFNRDEIPECARKDATGKLMVVLRKDLRNEDSLKRRIPFVKPKKLNHDDYNDFKIAMLRHLVIKANVGNIELRGTPAELTCTKNVTIPSSQKDAKSDSRNDLPE